MKPDYNEKLYELHRKVVTSVVVILVLGALLFAVVILMNQAAEADRAARNLGFEMAKSYRP